MSTRAQVYSSTSVILSHKACRSSGVAPSRVIIASSGAKRSSEDTQAKSWRSTFSVPPVGPAALCESTIREFVERLSSVAEPDVAGAP